MSRKEGTIHSATSYGGSTANRPRRRAIIMTIAKLAVGFRIDIVSDRLDRPIAHGEVAAGRMSTAKWSE
jgi:hypothetical protein